MPQSPVARLARRAVAGAADPEWSDGRLVGRFVSGRDEAAFAALVERHGPMVLAVCRRGAGDPHLADDAFQATFLVLARRAAAVSPREAVRGWLYGVAVRTAREARRMAARRRRRETPVPSVPDRPDAEHSPPDPDDLRTLDEEIGRLPELLRAAVVLCELDGLPRKDAAARLGVPEGTLSSRLAKARKLLAARLRSRGVTAPAAGLAVLVPQASVPTALADVAAGFGGAYPIPAAVAELTREVFRTMLLAKLKLAALPATAVVLVAAVMAGGASDRAGLLAQTTTPTTAPRRVDPPAVPKVIPFPGKLIAERNGKLWMANPDGTRPGTWEFAAGSTVGVPRLSPNRQLVALVLRDEKSYGSAVSPKFRVPENRPVADVLNIIDRLDEGRDYRLELDGVGMGLAWSPDGTRIAACVLDPSRNDGSRFTTWLIDPAAKSKTRLELPPNAYLRDWSPDGKALLVVVGGPMAVLRGYDLAFADVAGGHVTTLTRMGITGAARVSPDGTKVLFVDRDPDEGTRPIDAPTPSHLHLYTLDLRTKARSRLAAVPKDAYVMGCAWSPDGKKVAFTWTERSPVLGQVPPKPVDGVENNNSHLVVCDADGSNPNTIATEPPKDTLYRPLGAIDWR